MKRREIFEKIERTRGNGGEVETRAPRILLRKNW